MGRHLIFDVSGYQPADIDWRRMKREHPDLAGAICKIGEGRSTKSAPGFEKQVEGLHAAGLLAGAYWFFHPSNAGTADVEVQLERAKRQKLELGFWCDVEVSNGLDGRTVLQRVLEDMAPIRAAYGDNSGIYTGAWFWDPNTVGSVAARMEQHRLWVSGYGVPAPILPVPWKQEWLWQFTDKFQTHIGGLDASVFMGDEAAWNKWVGKPAPLPPPTPVGDARTRGVQAAVNAKPDGIWGEDTDTRCESVRVLRNPSTHKNRQLISAAQRTLNLTVDGILGNKTALTWLLCVSKIQTALGIKSDGLWGVRTDAAYLAASPLR